MALKRDFSFTFSLLHDFSFSFIFIFVKTAFSVDSHILLVKFSVFSTFLKTKPCLMRTWNSNTSPLHQQKSDATCLLPGRYHQIDLLTDKERSLWVSHIFQKSRKHQWTMYWVVANSEDLDRNFCMITISIPSASVSRTVTNLTTSGLSLNKTAARVLSVP